MKEGEYNKMKNKITGFIRGLITIILMVVMCFGTVVPAFATDLGGNENSPAEAVITKQLILPEKTTIPDTTFTFTFDKVHVDGKKEISDTKTMPNIEPIEIKFTSTDDYQTNENEKSITKRSSNVLSGVSFPHAGAYAYIVKETKIEDNNYICSPAQYTLTFFVKDEDNKLYVKKIHQEINIDNNGKVVNSKADDILFINYYTKRISGDSLTISKQVAGEFGDQKQTYFDFEVNIKSAVNIENDTYNTFKAYVKNLKDDSFVKAEDNNDNPVYYEFTSGINKVIKLKHDQKLVFTDLYVDAQYEVKEKAVNYYIATAEVFEKEVKIEVKNIEANKDLSTGVRWISESENKAAFTNTYMEIAATGVVMNNLPFILILLLAAGALISFIIVKSRKKNRYTSEH